jgi:hypothetical protein
MPRYLVKVHHNSMRPGEIVSIGDPEAWEGEIARGFLVALDDPVAPFFSYSTVAEAIADEDMESVEWVRPEERAEDLSLADALALIDEKIARKRTKKSEPGLVPGESEPWAG